MAELTAVLASILWGKQGLAHLHQVRGVAGGPGTEEKWLCVEALRTGEVNLGGWWQETSLNFASLGGCQCRW